MSSIEFILSFWQTVSATVLGFILVFITYLISAIFLMNIDIDELEEKKRPEDLGGGVKRDSQGNLIIDTSETKERREEQKEKIENKIQQGISVETLEQEETDLMYDYTRVLVGIKDVINMKTTDYIGGVVSEKIIDSGSEEKVFSIGILYSESLKGYALKMFNYKIKEGTKEMEGYNGNGKVILIVKKSEPSKEGFMEAKSKLKEKEDEYIEELLDSLKNKGGKYK